MDEFLLKLRKIKSGIFGRMRLIFILDLIVIFSIIYSTLIILNLEYFINKTTFYIPFPVSFIAPAIALLSGGLITYVLHRKDRRINLHLLIENKYSELREKLRTAYDSRDESNIIVDALKSEVSGALDKVSPAQILTTGKMLFRLIIAVAFLAGTAAIVQNPGPYQVPASTIEDISKTITGGNGNETSEAAGDPEEFGKAGGIETKPKIASIEGKNIDLTIFPGYEQGFELKDISPIQNQFIKSAAFPVDVLGSNVSDGGYSLLMKKTETEKQLINKFAVERSKI